MPCLYMYILKLVFYIVSFQCGGTLNCSAGLAINHMNHLDKRPSISSLSTTGGL